MFRHEALIYDSDEGFLDAILPFLRAGALAGEPTLVGLNRRLRRILGAAVGPHAGVTLLSDEEYREPLRALRQARWHARQAGTRGSRIRLLGAIPQAPWRSWLRYEAAVNRLLADCSIWGVCLYDARSTSDEILADVERTHPLLVSVERPARHRRGPRLPFEDPAELVNRRNRAEAQCVEATPPDLELVDPSPGGTRQVLSAAAAPTRLEDHEVDTLCLCTVEVIANASEHGRPPVCFRAWIGGDQVDVMVRDAGRGPADPFVGLLPRDGDGRGEPGTMHDIYQAVSDVAVFTDERGFTVWLTQRGAR